MLTICSHSVAPMNPHNALQILIPPTMANILYQKQAQSSKLNLCCPKSCMFIPSPCMSFPNQLLSDPQPTNHNLTFSKEISPANLSILFFLKLIFSYCPSNTNPSFAPTHLTMHIDLKTPTLPPQRWQTINTAGSPENSIANYFKNPFFTSLSTLSAPLHHPSPHLN